MVKVVEQAPAKRCTCYHCKAVLEYNYSDITEEFFLDYDGGGDTVYRITCPACGLKNNVSRWK